MLASGIDNHRRRRAVRPVALATALAALALAASASSALGATFTVTNTTDVGQGSLRWAIDEANAQAGADVIAFAIIPGAGPHVIAPATDLPTVTERVAIDGYSQPGAVKATSNAPAQLQVVIDASAANYGLELATDDSVVRGLVVQNSLDDGIRIQGDGNRVMGSYIGTDVTGTQQAGNVGDGVAITGDGNVVGGTAPQGRNVVSGNNDGISIVGLSNRVEGNAIGTDVSMTVALGNYHGVEIDGGGNRVGGAAPGQSNVISGNNFGVRVLSGTGSVLQGNVLGPDWSGEMIVDQNQNSVLVEEGSAGNFVGGAAPGEGNLISGGDIGVELDGDANTVQGNTIGTTLTGDAALPNDDGIQVSGDYNQIGGEAAGEGNVVSGNEEGIAITGLANVVEGNLIGTNAEGTARLPNEENGVEIFDADSNRIGGVEPGAGNVIAGNGEHGVQIVGFAEHARMNSVLGNHIGTDASGTLDLGNGGSGVWIEGGRANDVGHDTAEGANTIAFNDGDGVTVVSGDNNGILRNSIFENGDLGIDLDDDGPTANDGALDPDNGGNDLQNYPEITNVLWSGSSNELTVDWTLDSLPLTYYRIEFYANRFCEGDREGRTFLGMTQVTTDAAGHAAGATTFGALPLGITATASLDLQDPMLGWLRNTSEFTPCHPVGLDL